MALNLPTLPLQARRRPSPAACSPVFKQLSGLVSKSAVMRPVGQYTREMDLFSAASWTKWNRMSICFIRAWCCPFLDSAMADWLSQCKTIRAVGGEVSDPARA